MPMKRLAFPDKSIPLSNQPGSDQALLANSSSNQKTSNRKRTLLLALLALLVAVLAATFTIAYALWHSGYVQTGNSYFSSEFLKNRKVLVLVAHEDDEMNLAYGVIDAFTAAGSDVTIAFATNGDSRFPGAVRVAEAIRVDDMMGVPKKSIVLLGYGDHIFNPPLCLGEPDRVRKSEAGHIQTYGLEGIPDYHTLCFGKPAAYTRANCEGDIRRLIETLRPDVLFVTDTDEHVDHASLSQMFDRTMGRVLRENTDYRPLIFKGFAYEYAWHGNRDFYQLPLLSACQPWSASSYETAYAWPERVRFPLPPSYLSYTLRGSKLRKLLLGYGSQNAVIKQANLQNGDRVFWERRSDMLFGQVSASSGDASKLNDFVIAGMAEDPDGVCWFPAPDDPEPEIRFRWDAPQAIDEIVFYDSPDPNDGVVAVRVTADSGRSQDYALPNGDGKPCRLSFQAPGTRQLTIRVLDRKGKKAGLAEIAIYPKRPDMPQWIKLTDQKDNFCYETACAAQKPLDLSLYGYPTSPAVATATLTREGDTAPMETLVYDGRAFHIPPLAAGRYRLKAVSGACTDEVLLRVGDSMLWERGLQWLERNIGEALPN